MQCAANSVTHFVAHTVIVKPLLRRTHARWQSSEGSAQRVPQCTSRASLPHVPSHCCTRLSPATCLYISTYMYCFFLNVWFKNARLPANAEGLRTQLGELCMESKRLAEAELQVRLRSSGSETKRAPFYLNGRQACCGWRHTETQSYSLEPAHLCTCWRKPDML